MGQLAVLHTDPYMWTNSEAVIIRDSYASDTVVQAPDTRRGAWVLKRLPLVRDKSADSHNKEKR